MGSERDTQQLDTQRVSQISCMAGKAGILRKQLIPRDLENTQLWDQQKKKVVKVC